MYLRKQKRIERVRIAYGEFSERYDGRTRELWTEQFYQVIRVRGPEILRVVRTPEDHRHEICKVKRIALNYKNSQIINFSSIRKLIMDNGEKKVKQKRRRNDRDLR